MRETTTFGVRVLPVERMVLDERREDGGGGRRARCACASATWAAAW